MARSCRGRRRGRAAAREAVRGPRARRGDRPAMQPRGAAARWRVLAVQALEPVAGGAQRLGRLRPARGPGEVDLPRQAVHPERLERLGQDQRGAAVVGVERHGLARVEQRAIRIAQVGGVARLGDLERGAFLLGRAWLSRCSGSLVERGPARSLVPGELFVARQPQEAGLARVGRASRLSLADGSPVAIVERRQLFGQHGRGLGVAAAGLIEKQASALGWDGFHVPSRGLARVLRAESRRAVRHVEHGPGQRPTLGIRQAQRRLQRVDRRGRAAARARSDRPEGRGARAAARSARDAAGSRRPPSGR